MEKNTLSKNIVRVFSANFLVTIVGFISSFVFPKILSIDAYAIYHTYTLYLGYIAILHLGFPSGLVIRYAGKDYQSLDKSQYKAELTILMLILVSFTLLFFLWYIVTPTKILLYVTMSIIPVCWIGSYKALVQAWNNFKEYARINLFASISVPVIAMAYYFLTGNLPGEIYILIYLSIHIVLTASLIISAAKDLKGIKSNSLFTTQNWQTEKTGAIVAVGSYINTLFASADKQFVNWFFSSSEFAYYSFAMSMQAIMSVLISSVSQPLLPAIAQGEFKDREYDDIKSILIVFGSFSGAAYYVVSIIVNTFISKYSPSLDVAAFYFLVFPAMAVIQCLYINLYKVKGKVKTYVFTLALILAIAVLLNLLMVKIYNKFTGIAIATVMTYYIWLFIGSIQFDFIKISKKDLLYLLLYGLAYFLCIRHLTAWVGLVCYTCVIIILSTVIYGKMLKSYLLNLIK